MGGQEHVAPTLGGPRASGARRRRAVDHRRLRVRRHGPRQMVWLRFARARFLALRRPHPAAASHKPKCSRAGSGSLFPLDLDTRAGRDLSDADVALMVFRLCSTSRRSSAEARVEDLDAWLHADVLEVEAAQADNGMLDFSWIWWRCFCEQC